MLPLYIIADALGSPASPEKRGKLEERENEVDDFPVIWAGVGETARTLPWQLDPSRRPWRMSDAVLWSVPRKDITGAEIKPFSVAESDFKISFRDGSWARLTSSPYGARRIVTLLGSGTPSQSGQADAIRVPPATSS
ncbi:hypothetical protein QF034_008110 [Streptomyces africanus]|uniref:Uncharacterized protein n=1 Tax=Streptomyces africanus TaxID=231024 RepID=A0ABU0R2I8_9ACTN|nr:hypothetical protein [Streptomyces africanus]MDQ0753879.1 hypothetical protein [Streptomyces africanus]